MAGLFLAHCGIIVQRLFFHSLESFMSELSHFDSEGASRMVDVSGKDITFRQAHATAIIEMKPETLTRIRDKTVAKGDVFEVARLAGIGATKKTADLIPLCHPLSMERVDISFEALDDCRLRIDCRCGLHARTGVEMEALTAVSVAALTIYDMCKAIDREMTIGPIRLLEKSGGRSGHFLRTENGD